MTVTTTASPPPLLRHELRGRDGEAFIFHGRHLGHGTSEQPGKNRWFEVDVYRRENVHDGVRVDDYVVHTRGMTAIEGERTLSRIEVTTSPYEIIELLTVIRERRQFLPRQSARALAQAAQWDDGVRDAYVNRAVT